MSVYIVQCTYIYIYIYIYYIYFFVMFIFEGHVMSIKQASGYRSPSL